MPVSHAQREELHDEAPLTLPIQLDTFPTINAALNSSATVLLLAGFWAALFGSILYSIIATVIAWLVVGRR